MVVGNDNMVYNIATNQHTMRGSILQGKSKKTSSLVHWPINGRGNRLLQLFLMVHLLCTV